MHKKYKKRFTYDLLSSLLSKRDIELVKRFKYDPESGTKRWPFYGETMVGMKRLNNVQYAVETVLENGIEGDFIETGVWRGGSCILMKAILKSNGVADRKIFVADSFEGLPPPNDEYEADKGDEHYKYEYLAVSKEQVENNFRKYGLLDDNVVFLKGWFKDTLPAAPIEKLAIMRLDGDMYESTMDGFVNLYPKLSSGGFCIIDDYNLEPCREAIEDYRKQNGITEPIQEIDGMGVFWVKQ